MDCRLPYLKCHSALNHVWDEERDQLRCGNRGWVRYEKLERAVVDFAAGWLALHRDKAPDADITGLEIEIAEAHRHLNDKQKQARNAAESFVKTSSPTMERLMLQLEVEVEQIGRGITISEDRLSKMRSSAPSPDFLAKIEQQKEAVFSDDVEERHAARIAMKQTLRGLIHSMRCDAERNTQVIVGDNAIRFTFDRDGELIENEYGQGTIFLGPDGEIDWHPDYPDAEYQRLA